MARRPYLPQLHPLALIGGLGYIATSVIAHLLFTVQIVRLDSSQGDWEKHEKILETLDSYSKIFPLLEGLLAGAACLGLALTVAMLRQRLKAAAIGGAIAFAVVAWMQAVMWYSNQFEAWDSSFVQLFRGDWFQLLVIAGGIAGVALLGAVVFRYDRDEDAPIDPRLTVVIVLAAAAWATQLYNLFTDTHVPLFADSPWLRFVLSSGFLAAAGGVLASGLMAPETGSRYTGGAAEPDDLIDARWGDVADGLFTFGNALTWRLWVAVFAAMGTFWAFVAESAGLLKLVSVLAPLATLIVMLIMLTGIFRYARQPVSSPARGTAWLAFLVTLVAFALDAYGFKLVFEIVSADPQDWESLGRAQEAEDTAQSLSLWSLLLPFTGVLLLLSSFAQLAHHIGRRDLAGRTGGVALLLVGAAALIAFLRDHMESVRSIHEAILLGGIMLTAAVLILRQLIALVGSLEDAVRGTATDGEVPEARVV